MGFYPQAEKLFREARKNFEKIGHRQGKAWATLLLSFVYRGICNFSQSEDYMKESRLIYKELDLKDRVGYCLLNEAAIKRLVGKDEEAMLVNKRAIQLFSPLRNHEGVAWGLFQVGQILRDRGQFLKSWQTLREALNLHTDIANKKGMGWAQNDWGRTYIELNDLTHAREVLVKAKVLADVLDEGPLKAEVNKNLAHLCIEEGLIQKASQYLDQAISISQKVQSRDCEAESFLERARYYLILDECQKAREWINAADTLIEKNNLYRLKSVLGLYLGEIFAQEGKLDSAKAMLNDVLEWSNRLHQRANRAMALIGLVQLKIKKFCLNFS